MDTSADDVLTITSESDDFSQMLIHDIHHMAMELRQLGEDFGVILPTEPNLGGAVADLLPDDLRSLATPIDQRTSSSRGTMTVPVEETVFPVVGPQGEPGASLLSGAPSLSTGSYHRVDDMGKFSG